MMTFSESMTIDLPAPFFLSDCAIAFSFFLSCTRALRGSSDIFAIFYLLMVLEIKYNQSHELCYFKMEELSFDEVLKGAPFSLLFHLTLAKTNA